MNATLSKTVFSTPCVVCGEIVEIELCQTGDERVDSLMRSLAKRTAHTACKDGVEARRAEKEAVERIAKRSGQWHALCPALYRDSAEWVQRPQAKRVLRYKSVVKALAWAYGPSGLVLFGRESGTGKTTAAWVIVRREFDAGRFVVALTHAQLSDEATKFACGDAGKGWQSVLKRCDLLLVDDLGKSRFKSASGAGRASEEFLFELVDSRIRDRLPTILTSNTDGEGLKAAMSEERGEAFVRRLREFFKHVNFD